MVRLLNSRMDTLDNDPVIEKFAADFETEDGRNHTIVYELDDDLYARERSMPPVLFLSDFITGFTEFTEASAIACAEMLEKAQARLSADAEMSDLSDGYTLAPEWYDISVSSYGPTSHDFMASMAAPSSVEGCNIVAEETDNLGTRFIVRDWNRQLHQILFDDGRLVDSQAGYSVLSADALDATFAAIRTVQAEAVSRGDRLETEYEIELYNSGAVSEYRHL